MDTWVSKSTLTDTITDRDIYSPLHKNSTCSFQQDPFCLNLIEVFSRRKENSSSQVSIISQWEDINLGKFIQASLHWLFLFRFGFETLDMSRILYKKIFFLSFPLNLLEEKSIQKKFNSNHMLTIQYISRIEEPCNNRTGNTTPLEAYIPKIFLLGSNNFSPGSWFTF